MKLDRDFAAVVMVHSGLVRAACRLDSIRVPNVRVLAYHRVMPRVEEDSFPYDVELISAWEEDFDWQVGYLASNYDVITAREIASMLEAGRAVPRRAVIITFDDGFRDNHDVALPILQRHKVPAVVFVSTGYMDLDVTFWFDELVHDILATNAREVALGSNGAMVTIGSDIASRREAARQVLRHLKTVPNEQRLLTLARLKQELGVPTPDRQPGLNGPLTWAQVAALSGAGIEIGSHSISHPILSTMNDADELRRELTESKVAIEKHIGRPVVSMAYPVGGRTAYNDHVVAAARDAGYRFAFTYGAGPNPPDAFDAHRMRRLAVERYVSRNRFKAMLAIPALFANGWSGC